MHSPLFEPEKTRLDHSDRTLRTWSIGFLSIELKDLSWHISFNALYQDARLYFIQLKF
jgi:hypothetical protein